MKNCQIPNLILWAKIHISSFTSGLTGTSGSLFRYAITSFFFAVSSRTEERGLWRILDRCCPRWSQETSACKFCFLSLPRAEFLSFLWPNPQSLKNLLRHNYSIGISLVLSPSIKWKCTCAAKSAHWAELLHLSYQITIFWNREL